MLVGMKALFDRAAPVTSRLGQKKGKRGKCHNRCCMALEPLRAFEERKVDSVPDTSREILINDLLFINNDFETVKAICDKILVSACVNGR